MMSDAGSSSMVDGMNDEELFKSGAIFAVNRRFPSNDKISIFHGPDFASDAMMASMKLVFECIGASVKREAGHQLSGGHAATVVWYAAF